MHHRTAERRPKSALLILVNVERGQRVEVCRRMIVTTLTVQAPMRTNYAIIEMMAVRIMT